MNIAIATGIYPPEIGGPSEYARQLFETLTIQNHRVMVVTYNELKFFPTGMRHFLYFCKLVTHALDADYIIALDTFSTALPAVFFARLLGKKIVVRMAGDFLWESYLERTHEEILLSEFYSKRRAYTLKERIIFHLTRLSLQSASMVVFSTEWQRNFTLNPYGLTLERTRIIENFYPEMSASPKAVVNPVADVSSQKKVFLSPSRARYIKNKKNIEAGYALALHEHVDIELDTHVVSREVLLEKIHKAYAVIVASFSEVSPNFVIDALRSGVPVIVTEDIGIKGRIQDVVVFVNPFSVENIAEGIMRFLDPEVYESYRSKISTMSFVHSWNEIAQEFLDMYSSL